MQIKLGVNREFAFEAKADAIALHLSEPDSQNISWLLDVYAQLETGRTYVGSLNTVSANFPTSNTTGLVRGNRVVLYATCPGARAWRVVATGPTGSPDVTGELRATMVEAAATGVGVGLFRPGGRVVYNGGRTSIPINDARQDAQGPCALTAVMGSNESSPAVQFWLMFFNATAVPPNGTQPWQGLSINVPAGGSFSQQFGQNGLFFPVGLVWAVSTTPDTLTFSGSNARVQTVMAW